MWRDIWEAKHVLMKVRRIGDERSVMIWDDPWVPGVDDIYLCTKTRKNKLRKDKVDSLLGKSSNTWAIDKINNFFNARATTEIIKIPLSSIQHPDKWYWAKQRNVNVSMQSPY